MDLHTFLIHYHLEDTDGFHVNKELLPAEECRVLPCGEASENESQTVRRWLG